jgi:hypothetical protein
LRAEGAGMLSGTMFLSLVIDYLKVAPLTVDDAMPINTTRILFQMRHCDQNLT